jgi:ABC-2 type transport system permease protein
MSTTRTLARQDLRLLRVDAASIPLLAIAAILAAMFFRPTLDRVIGPDGKLAALVGLTMFFSFYVIPNAAVITMREASWGALDQVARLLPTSKLVTGKLVVPYLMILAFILLSLGGGALVMGLDITDNPLPLAGAVALHGVLLVSWGAVLLMACPTLPQINSANSLMALVLCAGAGALLPIETLPAPIEWVAPGLPTYWSREAFSEALLEGSTSRWLMSLAVVAAWTVGFGLLALVAGRRRSRRTPTLQARWLT